MNRRSGPLTMTFRFGAAVVGVSSKVCSPLGACLFTVKTTFRRAGHLLLSGLRVAAGFSVSISILIGTSAWGTGSGCVATVCGSGTMASGSTLIFALRTCSLMFLTCCWSKGSKIPSNWGLRKSAALRIPAAK